MFNWLQSILGEQYTKEIDKKIAQEIGKRFVAKSDFNTVKKEKCRLENSLHEMEERLYDIWMLSRFRLKNFELNSDLLLEDTVLWKGQKISKNKKVKNMTSNKAT